ncbi:MAG: DegT/DnrJ/EryC1/StrS family aminotransferase [Chitinophagaceae bacterium]
MKTFAISRPVSYRRCLPGYQGDYKGKALGTIGNVCTFSFDFVKIITCGEGGAIIKNDSELAEKCDHYSDHGHDHYGKDRAPICILTSAIITAFRNYTQLSRLSQVRKLDHFLELQRRNHRIIRESPEHIPGIFHSHAQSRKVIPGRSFPSSCQPLSWLTARPGEKNLTEAGRKSLLV